ncbi:cysteine desulfurase family protein [Mangrovibacillus cuniculi]|uniref:Cysteine desulfurase n=1 Tax=Mangrovibacillus cuniculi TaxID=2593652 RepID=A0A7S8HFT1_9BACI|nr:cysteine desulfurase family protein [Mangrovibacillus cuniculi]QPC47239.1 cysteine desulfurase [Mangrovibacillus cuniculi]
MIYLDNSATTQPFAEVVDTFATVSTKYFGNPSSLHELGSQSSKLLQKAREQVATICNVQPRDVVFTSGGTEGNNMIVKGVAEQNGISKTHIITAETEHPSILETVHYLEKQGAKVSYIPVDESGLIQLSELEAAITNDTTLVTFMSVNNETGVVQPISKIGEVVKKYSKAHFHVDHVQGMTKVELKVDEWHIDSFTISGHKVHGLKGTGALILKKNKLVSPLLRGGGQEQDLRSGTENVAGAVSLAKALRLVEERKNLTELSKLTNEFKEKVKHHPKLLLNSPLENSAPHIINFSAPGTPGEVLVHALEMKGIYVSTTSACSSKLAKASTVLLAMGRKDAEAKSSIRISLSIQSTEEELIKAWSALEAFLAS